MTRMLYTRSTLLLLAALGAGVPPACLAQAAVSAAPSAVTGTLLDKARTLETKGRIDMAAQTWQQVLLADPNNAEALGGLARAAKVAGNQALANTYLQRLRAVNPTDPGIARAEGMMTQSNQLAELQKAGRLAGQGNYAQAMVIYRQVFGNTPPIGDWSLAYYETEAATDDGRPHAIAGFRSLVDRYPQDSRYQIALGRILTYNPQTRSEGRRLLEHHPRDPGAVEALKQSLVWDAQNPASTGEIRSYLRTHPDAELQQSLTATENQARATRAAATRASRPSTPAGSGRTARTSEYQPAPEEPPSADVVERRESDREEQAAYAALNGKRFAEADSMFTAILQKRPDDARALAGMGYVRMNQQNFGGAISFLEQAKQDGAKDAGLDKNLEIARFYYVLGEGGTALNENDLTTAEAKYRQALQMRPASPEATEGLAGTLLKAGEPQPAVALYQELVRIKPSASAWRGLFTAQYQAGDANGALATERRIPAAVRAQLMRDPDFLRTLASAYQAAGRDADAQRVLRSALDLPFPEGARGLKAETQLQYASLLLQANHTEQAAGLYRQVLAGDPNNVLAWQGLVNAEHALGNDAVALQTIESMPPAVYDQALRDPGFLIATASVYQANKKDDLAQSLLERAIAAENTSGQRVPLALQLQLAGLYLQRGDAAHAYPIYQRVLSENPERVDAWKGLLNAMHSSGRDGEVLAEVQQIPPAVRKQLENDVQYLQVIGQVYASLGDSRESLFFLNRVQQHYAAQRTAPPADVDIQSAYLLYSGMNDAGLYRQLLFLGGRHDLTDEQRRSVQTIWANWAVRRANQASSAGNTRRALAILNAAAKAFPDNPAVVNALAGGYVRAGLPKEAVAIFKAQDMSAQSLGDYKTAIGAALAANDPKDTEAWLRYALVKYPKDGQLLGYAAKFEQARGDSSRAAEYYKASLDSLPRPDPGSELAYVLSAPAPLNPRALPAAPSQDLASLLAPGSDPSASAAARTPAQPYLPSSSNTFGSAPVQVGNSSAGMVPGYMRNPNRGGTSRLGDYKPSVSAEGFDPSGYSYPQEYQAPAGAYLPSGRSANQVPADAQPVAADSTPYLAFQQEQIRRANDEAIRTGSVADDMQIAVARGEGAQTGDFNGEVYGPYVPYQAPLPLTGPAVSYTANEIEVPDSTIITTFPTGPGRRVTLHNANSSGKATGVAHPSDEAAEAAETRRHQSDPTTAQVEDPTDVSNGHTVQYTGQMGGGSMTPAQGQTARPSSMPATAPTNTAPSYNSYSTSSTAGFDGGNGSSSAQQYPQPLSSSRAYASGARRRSRPVQRAQRIDTFGVTSAPIFYPGVATGLGAEPYPDLPPYNSNGQQPPTDPELIARNVIPLRHGYYAPDASLGAAGGPPLTERQQTELDLAQLDASYSGWVGGSAFLRARSGEPGIDRLRAIEVPVEATFVAGKRVRFSVVPRAVFLQSGTIDNTRYANGGAPYLGTLTANAINTPAPQYASGIGGELQMVSQNFGLAAGYTPYEFLVNNFTARARYRILGGPFTVFGERDSVKETQLSYAGLRDPGSVTLLNSGNIWGGVVATGGGLRFDHGNERAGLYLSGDGATLTGFHVLDNRRYEGTAGAYFRVKQFPGVGVLNIGASLFAEHFDHNERALTYGNGGYFSPEIYFLGSVPFTFTGYYRNKLHYVVQAALGVQTFQEDTAPLFPLDAATQTNAQTGCTLVQLANHTCGAAEAPVNTDTGFNFGVQAEAAYRLTEHFFVGGALEANNTNNYNVVQPTVFLRYTFKAQYPTDDYPTGLFPIAGFRPLRVP